MARDTGLHSKGVEWGVEAVPGATVADAETVRRTVNKQQRGVERDLRGAAKQVKLTNRAEKGHVKVFIGCFDGETYPDDADGEDRATWLQPGESMVVPMAAALHFCGNVWDPKKGDAEDVIARYGGWEMELIPAAGLPGKTPPMNVIGPPLQLPDLLVVQVDQRGKEMHKPISMWDLYVSGKKFNALQRPAESARQEEYREERAREVATA
jgi:hypothetical protein